VVEHDRPVTLLLLKLTLTPLLIVAASLAGRRWGNTVSGWIVGMPLTSAPVSLFVALQHDKTFAVHAAIGSIAGVVAECALFLTWGLVGDRSWAAGVGLGTVVFWAIGLPSLRAWPILPLAAVTLVLLAASQFLMRTLPERPNVVVRPPRWDLWARAAVATVLVLALTEASGALGPRLTGLFAVYPLYSIVLASFAHHAAGAPAALRVLRGVLVGLFAFVAFFFTLGLVLPHTSIAVGYLCAAAAVAGVQLVSVRALPKPPPPGVSMRTTSPARS
jgi:hypothetical protein